MKEKNPDLTPEENRVRQTEDLISSTVKVSIPAVVTSVSQLGSDQMVEVRPLVTENDEQYIALQHSVIYDVPVVFPAGGGALLSLPMAVGDTVLVLFSHRSIGEWLNSDGSETVPRTLRRFSLTDAIAIPGLYTKSSNLSPNTTDVELKFKGSSIRIQPNGDVNVNSVNDVTISAAQTINVVSNGDINLSASGDVNITCLLYTSDAADE